MPNSQIVRMNRIRRHAEAMKTDLETVIAWDSAVSLAYKERTGVDLGEGESYSPADAARADEIILLFPRHGA
jgi:hypothetical protein